MTFQEIILFIIALLQAIIAFFFPRA